MLQYKKNKIQEKRYNTRKILQYKKNVAIQENTRINIKFVIMFLRLVVKKILRIFSELFVNTKHILNQLK